MYIWVNYILIKYVFQKLISINQYLLLFRLFRYKSNIIFSGFSAVAESEQWYIKLKYMDKVILNKIKNILAHYRTWRCNSLYFITYVNNWIGWILRAVSWVTYDGVLARFPCDSWYFKLLADYTVTAFFLQGNPVSVFSDTKNRLFDFPF